VALRTGLSRRLGPGVACVMAGLLAGCSASAPRAGPGPTPATSPSPPAGRPGGTLTIVGVATRAQLDPGAATDDASLLLGRLAYRQLYSYGTASPAPVPDLAAGPPELLEGGRVVRIKLRGDVRWNVPSQRKVASTDVVRGLKRLCLPGRVTAARGYLGQIVTGYAAACRRLSGTARPTAAVVDALAVPGLVAVGDDRVELRLLRPAPDLVGVLAQPATSPVPAELAVPTARQDVTQLVGDGPYRFGVPEAGELYRLTRNPAWDPSSDAVRQALVDRVVVSGGRTPAAVLEQVRSGTADLAWDLRSDTADAAAARLLPPSGATPAPAADAPAATDTDTDTATASPARGSAVAQTPGRTVTLLVAGSRGPASALMRRLTVRAGLAACVDRPAVATALGAGSTALGQLLPAEVAPTDGAVATAADQSPVSPSPATQAPATSPAVTRAPAPAGARAGASQAAASAALCRAVLSRAGMPQGTTLTVLAADMEPVRRAVGALGAGLAVGGVHLRVIAAPGGANGTGSLPAAWDLALLQVQPAPSGTRGELAPLLDPRWPGAAGLPGITTLAQGQPHLEELQAALAESDAAERAQAVALAVQGVQVDAALVPLAETPTIRPVGPHLSAAPVLALLGNVDPANAALDVTRPRTEPAKGLPSQTPTP